MRWYLKLLYGKKVLIFTPMAWILGEFIGFIFLADWACVKESVFSDLNNLAVIYNPGQLLRFYRRRGLFSLRSFGMSEKKNRSKTMGKSNPWSKPYWAATSSNALISKLIQTASADMKKQMERLLNGELITVSFDEQVVFSQLEQDESAIWSLLVASGYLKVEDVEYRGMMEPWYHLNITNLETVSMFSNMFKGWLLR